MPCPFSIKGLNGAKKRHLPQNRKPKKTNDHIAQRNYQTRSVYCIAQLKAVVAAQCSAVGLLLKIGIESRDMFVASFNNLKLKS
jgi:hypothetical protein